MELVTAQFDRIARINPALNALVTLDRQGALAAAGVADRALAAGQPVGPLHGVPVTIKDLIAVRGLRTTLGFRMTANWLPEEDATAVARLRAAGAIIIGRSNVPQLGLDWQCESPIFGRTVNPWNPDRTPGGSTGGGAAAVAAGLTPLELGSDAAGSIRVPSHYCGVYGFKPTEHLVSNAGHAEVPGYPRGVRHIAVLGPLARSIDDLELALRLIAGADPRQSEVPPVPLATPASRPLQGRLFLVSDSTGIPVSAEISRSVRDLSAQLAAAGAVIEDRAPPVDVLLETLELWGAVFGAEMAAPMPRAVRFWFRTVLTTRYGRDRWTLGFRRGLAANFGQYVRALTARDRAIAEIDRYLGHADGWILPIAATVAFPHQKTGKPIAVDGKPVPYAMACGGHAAPASVTGHPAVALPVAVSRDGLPIGLQVVGRRWDDLGLLAAAKQIAGVTGGFRRPPDPEALDGG